MPLPSNLRDIGGKYCMVINSETKERVLHVLRRCAVLPEDLMESSNWQKPLTGKDYRLSAVDLVYLLLELEEEFGIRISSDSLNSYRFSSIEGICGIIQEHIIH